MTSAGRPCPLRARGLPVLLTADVMRSTRTILSSKVKTDLEIWMSSRLMARCGAQRLELTIKLPPGKPSFQNSPQVWASADSSPLTRCRRRSDWCRRRAYIGEPVIREQEHDDVATDRQGRVGRYREVGWLSGSYDPNTNRQCANADALAAVLSPVLGKRQNWLPNLVETEDAMREWEASTCCGSTSSSNYPASRFLGIDGAIEREAERRTAKASDSKSKKTQP